MDKKYQELLDKKSILDNELKNLEKSIFDNETKYLEETAYLGNVVKGWEGYLSLKNSKINGTLQRKGKINQNDRIFSQSSKTSPQIQEVQQIPQAANQVKVIFIEESGEEKKEYHFRRTKKKKDYANYQKIEANFHSPFSSSEEYPAVEKKIKGSKKF